MLGNIHAMLELVVINMKEDKRELEFCSSYVGMALAKTIQILYYMIVWYGSAFFLIQS